MEPTFDIIRLLPLLIPVIILQLGLMIFALIDLARRETVKHLPKYGWALVIIFVNMIGPIIYLLIGRSED
jgi:hypothetical protein